MTENAAYRRIWETVQHIPPGRVAAYGQVADLAGLPGRARLVGKALGEVPQELSVPWFRVLRADGRIAFPAGSNCARQQRERLLAEGVLFRGHRVRLSEYGWQPDLATLVFELSF